MIVRSIESLKGTDREVKGETWVSRRLLLKSDGMGFSFHETVLYTGTETRMWYKNHLEAVLCVEGEAEIEDLATGQKHRITPGTMYALNEHDRHVLRVLQDFRCVCVFNPPCTGQETHDAEGSYPLPAEEEPAAV
ncbi:MAG: L-ectoine synthase [Candidatus Hydrogenedens sp.]|nr:L-ectoine synthase [Candidatus Hydrogenedens sp.]